ncbi:MAG TPA: hypothetical protein VGQ52_02755 [Gemmatimonadaceae bacterium]|nr:hypothetical protein [Gemmatimonadaceae bacterium]
MAYIYMLTGRAQHARALLKAGQGSELDQPTYHAGVYAVIGDTAGAFAELDRAILTHDPLVGDMKVDPRLDPLRGHPRFIAIMQRLAFPP